MKILLKKFEPIARVAVAAGTLFATGCMTEAMTEEEIAAEEEALRETEQSVVNGSAAVGAARPYEKLFVRLSRGCSGTLVGGPTTAKWVLTAKHCFNSVNDPVTIYRGTESRASKRVIFAPNQQGEFIDAALIELTSSISVPGSVYFTNSDAQTLIGTPVRCYGFGNNKWTEANGWTGFGTLRWGDFTIKDHNGSPIYYQLTVPNGKNQAMAPGDSGGSCFHTAAQAVNDITITGVMKAANGGPPAVPTYNNQTGAKWMSAWVRSYVPRPD